jgi:hypothetical protein
MEDLIGVVVWIFLWEIFYFTGWGFIYLLTLGRLSIVPRAPKISRYWNDSYSHVGSFAISDFVFFAVGLAVWISATILIF